MCGIWGKIYHEPSQGHTTDHILSLCRLMGHRGPDGEGAWHDGRAALGHRRLAIIDLTGGHQPMPYLDGRYWMTYNGEIYNYRELKSTLQEQGYTFHTNSDTEVVLAAYHHWGECCPQHFNGIFAFGIWDTQEQTLFIARDHLGVKPLLYHYDDSALSFCSELKPLLAEERIRAGGLSRQGIADYLALGYVQSPRTIVEGVHRLPPGHFLMLKRKDLKIERYWHLPEQQIDSAGDWDERFLSALSAAVERQLVADVPVGGSLSGGLDSSSIVALMQEHLGGSAYSFSVGFSEKSYSELDFAGEAAQHLKTQHITEVLDSSRLCDDLPSMIWAYDEPLGDTSLIPTYYLAKFTAKHVKVALSGDGADELLAGYDTYAADLFQRYYQHLPSLLGQNWIPAMVGAMPSTPGKVTLQYRLEQFTRYAHEPAPVAHFRWRQLFTDSERAALLGQSPHIQNTLDHYLAHFPKVADQAPLNQMLYTDINTWMLDDILPKVDRASMACGLEVRVPFLDPRLVELTMQMPPELKMRGLSRKVILKRVMRDKLPKTTLTRSKRGFNAPTSIWMSGILRDLIEGLLRAPSSLLDTQSPALKRLWQDYLAGQANHGYKLWALVSLLLWENYVWKEINAHGVK